MLKTRTVEITATPEVETVDRARKLDSIICNEKITTVLFGLRSRSGVGYAVLLNVLFFMYMPVQNVLVNKLLNRSLVLYLPTIISRTQSTWWY